MVKRLKMRGGVKKKRIIISSGKRTKENYSMLFTCSLLS